jgi:predicted dehydrogenase
VPTLDGAVTNPFAHGLAAALALEGSTDEGDVLSVEAALFHANPVETDDTSSVRVHTRRGTVVTVAVTLCAAEPREPRLLVRGTRGSAELVYTEDLLRTSGAAGTREVRTGRTDLLENLLDHLDDGTPLLAPLHDAAAFMAVVEQVRLAPPARQVPPPWVVPAADGTGALTIPGVDAALRACVDGSLLLSETGVEWAQRAPQTATRRGGPA